MPYIEIHTSTFHVPYPDCGGVSLLPTGQCSAVTQWLRFSISRDIRTALDRIPIQREITRFVKHAPEVKLKPTLERTLFTKFTNYVKANRIIPYSFPPIKSISVTVDRWWQTVKRVSRRAKTSKRGINIKDAPLANQSSIPATQSLFKVLLHGLCMSSSGAAVKQALRRSAEKPVRASISGSMTISPSAFRRRREKGEWSENREKVSERERAKAGCGRAE